jgi:plasmid maintenance system antidote protein VapI
MDPIFWVNLQAEYDVRIAIRDNKKMLQSRIRVYQPLAA